MMMGTPQTEMGVLETATQSTLATIVPLNISDTTAMTTIAALFVETGSTQVELAMELTQQLMISQEDTVRMATGIFTTMDVIEIVKLSEVLVFMLEEELLLGLKNTQKTAMTLPIKSMGIDLARMETQLQRTVVIAQSVK